MATTLNPMNDPYLQALQGRIANVDWTGAPKAPMVGPVQAAPDVAAAAAQADAIRAQTAAAQAAAAGGIANQKEAEAVDAMASRETLKPKKAAIDRALKQADAIRDYGQSLNTGSVGGAAPNWAGALANVAGAYVGGKKQKQAEADALALGERSSDIAKLYFGNAPTSLF
jgi:hypothetical protein